MLTDTERKLLWMLWHNNGTEPAQISLDDYARRGGRTVDQVLNGLAGLAEKRAIEWEPTSCRAQLVATHMLRPVSPIKPWWEWD